MQVDVSPDGRTIVFDLLGDLYTMPIDGGTATRIIGGLSFESQPTWSPDGKTIAFLTDRTGVENLWIANADGSNPRAVSKDGQTNDRPQIMVSPAWTPDGQYIVVSKSRPPDPGTFWLFMYHRDGGNGVRVGAAPPPQPGPDAQGPPPPPPANRMGAVVSPDGRFIYYTQRTGTFTYNARFPLWQIYRHDRETGDVSQVTNAQGSAMRPAISPDGKWLVYGTRHKTADRPARPQSRDRRRALAGLSGDARRSGIARQPRHAAALRLHARRQVAGRADRRQAAARRLRDRRRDADSVHREGAGRDRAARLHAGARRRRRRRCARA